jgi:hypothetical protein
MTNRITAFLTVIAVGGLILAGSAAAQTTSTTQTTTQTTQAPATGATTGAPTQNAGPGSQEAGHNWENHVNDREQNQQNRIANGVQNGKLSAGQASHLENRENQIQEREAKDESEHGGHLTQQEKQHFQRAQNKVSKQINKDKSK